MPLSRPLALITGANRGIGTRAIAVHLQGTVSTVLAEIWRRPRRQQKRSALSSPEGGRFRFVSLDVTDIENHANKIAALRAENGPLTCLINNAGVQTQARGDMLDVTPEDYDRLLGVNLRGTFFLTQAVARSMIADEPGRAHRSVVTISSSAATIAYPTLAPYCLSKTGLSMMTKLFAIRLAEHGISAYEVRPGLIQTDMTSAAARSIRHSSRVAGFLRGDGAHRTMSDRQLHPGLE